MFGSTIGSIWKVDVFPINSFQFLPCSEQYWQFWAIFTALGGSDEGCLVMFVSFGGASKFACISEDSRLWNEGGFYVKPTVSLGAPKRLSQSLFLMKFTIGFIFICWVLLLEILHLDFEGFNSSVFVHFFWPFSKN